MEPAHEPPPPDDRVYYGHAGRVDLFRRISRYARMRVFRLFMETFHPDAATSVLDVGVSLDVANVESNLLERVYPHRDRLVCAGIGEGADFRRAFPEVRFVQITPHQPLPFADGEFDIVYSNAVVEHTGSRANQRAFVGELCRVGKRVFVVVPNRLFPIEHHTGLPLVHYLPLPAFRALLRATNFNFWAEEENLNPLYAGEFKDLFPPGRSVDVRYAGGGLSVLRSNIVAIG